MLKTNSAVLMTVVIAACTVGADYKHPDLYNDNKIRQELALRQGCQPEKFLPLLLNKSCENSFQNVLYFINKISHVYFVKITVIIFAYFHKKIQSFLCFFPYTYCMVFCRKQPFLLIWDPS